MIGYGTELWFGDTDMCMNLREPRSSTSISASTNTYTCGDQFHYLTDELIIDVEVLCFEERATTTPNIARPPNTIAEDTSVEAHGPVNDNDDVEEADVHYFGASMGTPTCLSVGQ